MKLENVSLGLTFDDVLLVPQFSTLSSRRDTDISTSICGIPLLVPIISANMDSITGVAMAKAMGAAGGLGILHRYQSVAHTVTSIASLHMSGIPAVPSIGVLSDGNRLTPKEHLRRLQDVVRWYRDAGARALCLDIAHAHCERAATVVSSVKEYLPVIAGNVATADGAVFLAEAGASCIKVGIGPGAVCTTREVTGHGYPQLSAVEEVVNAVHDKGVSVIADGGIKNSGDMVKALAVGSAAVMIGRLLAGTNESNLPRTYRGMASGEAREAYAGGVSPSYQQEGVAVSVCPGGPVSTLIQQFSNGIRSGLSYTGAGTLNDLKTNSRFVRVTTQGNIENGTRV